MKYRQTMASPGGYSAPSGTEAVPAAPLVPDEAPPFDLDEALDRAEEDTL